MHPRSIIPLLIFLFLGAVSVEAAPGSFTYQGQIIKPSGQALQASSVTFTLQIYSPPPSQCLLFEEEHTINMENSNGIFSIVVGEGSAPGSDFEHTNSIANAMRNLGSQAATTCAGASPYTPNADDERYLRVTFDDGTGPTTLDNDYKIVSVPFASFAAEAGSVAGISASDLLERNVSTGFNLNQTNLETVFTDTNWTELQALLDGSSASFGASSGSYTSGVSIDGSSDEIQLVVEGNGTQTTNLVEIRDSTSAVLATISSDGSVSNATDLTTKNYVDTLTGNYLPLSGDTMTGNLTMGGNQILNIGHMTQAPQSTITVGAYTNGEEATLVGSLGLANAGATWFNSTVGRLKVWSGSSAVELGPGTDNLGDHTATTALDMDGNIIEDLALGSAAAPSLSFTGGDTNTGIWSPAGDTLAVSTAGNEALRIDASGNVGIGTSTPGNGLHLHTVTHGQGVLLSNVGRSFLDFQRTNDAHFAGGLRWRNSSNSIGWQIGHASNSTTDLNIYDSSSEIMTFKQGGNVGVGTTAPAGKFHVQDSSLGYVARIENDADTGSAENGLEIAIQNGGSSAYLLRGLVTQGAGLERFYVGARGNAYFEDDVTSGANLQGDFVYWNNDSDGYVGAPADGTFVIATNGSERFRATPSGDIGVGTTTPAEKLDVNGDIKFDSANNITSTGAEYVNWSRNTANLGSGTYVRMGTGDGSGSASLEAIRSGASHAKVEVGNALNPSAKYIDLSINGVSRLHIDDPGNIGIGTTTPAALLDVAGIIRAEQVCDETGANCRDLSTAASSGDFMADGTVEMTGQFDSIDGTAGTPGISFNADNDTGLFQPADNNIALATGGNERIRIDASGNVGIGTDTPSAGLVVQKSTGDGIQLKDGDGDVRFNLRSDATTTYITSGSNGVASTALNIRASNNSPLYLGAHNGTVTIGPGPYDSSNAFEFVANGRMNASVYQSDTTSKVLSSRLDLGIYDDANDLGAINLQPAVGGVIQEGLIVEGQLGGGSFVGIGTSSPEVELDVDAGRINAAQVCDENNTNCLDLSSGSIGADNLGNHTATTNIQLSDNWLSNDGDTEGIRIDNSGNVGIGTASPGDLLHVYAPGSSNLAEFEADGNVSIRLNRTHTTDPGDASFNVTNLGRLNIYADEQMIFSPNNAEAMRINQTGNVGIGTNNPGYKLDVEGIIGFQDYIRGNDNGSGYVKGTAIAPGTPVFSFIGDLDTGFNHPAADELGFTTDNVERVRIDSSGNVGIGTTAPAMALDVVGDAHLQGGDLTLGVQSTTNGKIVFQDSGTVNSGSIEFLNNDLNLSPGNNGNINFDFVGNTKVTIDGNSGFMGLQDTSPDSILELSASGGTDDLLMLSSDDSNDGDLLIVKSDGDVGIGTTNPSVPLDVNGIAKAEKFFSNFDDSNLNEYPLLLQRSAGSFDAPVGSGLGLQFVNRNTGGLWAADEIVNRVFANSGTVTSGFEFVTHDNSLVGGTNTAMTIRGSRVGIATTNPGGKLDVAGDIRMLGPTSGYTGFQAPAVAPNLVYTLPGSSPTAGYVLSSDASGNLSWIDNGAAVAGTIIDGGNNEGATVTIGTNDAFGLNLETNNATAMTINSSGDIGIGTATPSSTLHLFDSRPDILTVERNSVNNSLIEYKNTTGSMYTGVTAITSPLTWGVGASTGLHTDSHLVVTAPGDVGVGTVTPEGTFHVYEGDSGATPNGTGDALVIESANNVGMSILTPNTSESYYMFGDNDNAAIAYLAYNHSEDRMIFRANASERMTIASDGKVGIGTNNPASELHIVNPAATRSIQLIADGGNSDSVVQGGYRLTLRSNSGGSFLRLQNDGTNSIGDSDPDARWEISADGSTGTPVLMVSSNDNSDGDYLIVDGTGNVGIGSTTPTEKLDVNGTIKATNFALGEASLASQFKFSDTNVTAGNLQPVARFKENEGTVSYIIQAQSITGGNSGTKTYLYQGGFNQITTSWHKMVPFAKGRGHGQSTDGFDLYVKRDSGDPYAYEFAVASVTSNKSLKVTFTKIGGDTTAFSYTDLSSSPEEAISSASDVYSHLELAVGENIGISTTTPAAPLHVVRNLESARFSSDNGQGTYLHLDNSNNKRSYIGQNFPGVSSYGLVNNGLYLGVADGAVGTNASDLIKISSADTDRIALVTNNQKRLVIDSTGSVGIGTNAPSEKLHLDGNFLFANGSDRTISIEAGSPGPSNQGGYLTISAGDGDSSANDSGGRLFLNGGEGYNAGTGGHVYIDGGNAAGAGADGDVFIATQRGNVGVGTTTPASKLHIDGSGAGGGVCVTSDGTCSAVPTGGEISAETTLNTGADYAEYFESEEELAPGEIVGLNPITGKVRRYQKGDNLLGIVSTDPGVVGNSELANQSNTVLVALVGQVPFNANQVKIKEGKLFTKDFKALGYLLANGHAYINFSSADQEQNQQIEKQAREISSLKQENKDLKKENIEFRKRLENIEKMLKK